MVRNNKRRAFTIVELVIVIAVIAILAAVMIPTFGGIIKRANISADTQIAASMNTQLSIYKAEGNKIETEADLWAALKSDADFTSQLDPKSAKHGYHFWYNANENKIELLANADVLGAVAQQAYNADPEGNVATPFAQAAPRLVKDGFYLLDKAGEGSTNEIANFFKAIESMPTNEASAYGDAINDLKNVKGDNEELAKKVLEKINATAVMTDKGVFINSSNINYIYIPAPAAPAEGEESNYYLSHTVNNANDPTATTFTANITGGVIEVPAHVKVAEGSFAEFGAITLLVDVKEDKITNLKDVFSAGAVDASATVQVGGQNYTIDGHEVKLGKDVVATLTYLNPVTDFSVKADSDISNIITIDVDNNGVVEKNNYIALDAIKSGNISLTLNADSFVGTPGVDTPVYEDVVWSVKDNTAGVMIHENGEVEFTPAEFTADTITFVAKAKAVNEGEVVKEYTVKVLRLYSAQINFAGDGTGTATLSNKVGENSASVSSNLFVGVLANAQGAITTAANFTTATNFMYAHKNTQVTLSTEQGHYTKLGINTGEITTTIVANSQTYFKLDDDKNLVFQNIGTLKGGYVTQYIEVTVSDGASTITGIVDFILNDNTDSPFENTFPTFIQKFEKDETGKDVDVTYVYKVGNGNTLPLDELFQKKSTTITGSLENHYLFVFANNAKQNDGYFWGPIAQIPLKDSNNIDLDKIDLTDTTKFNVGSVYWLVIGEKETITSGNKEMIIVSAKENVTNMVRIEVVSGKNFTDTQNLTNLTKDNGEFKYATYDTTYNIVLHDHFDIKTNPDGKPDVFLDDTTLYGNYFIITAKEYLDVLQGGQNGDEGKTLMTDGHSLIEMRGTSSLNQVIIDGPLYDEPAYASDTNGKFCFGILCWNTTTITDSYIYGFMSPIRVRTGTLELKNSVLESGTWSNLFVYEATEITLDNSMTIQDYSGYTPTIGKTDKIIGLGIYLHKSMVAKNIDIIFKGDTKQINWFGEDANFAGYAASAKTIVFAKEGYIIGDYKYKEFMHKYDGENFVNAGIAFQCLGSTGTPPTVNFDPDEWTTNIKYGQESQEISISWPMSVAYSTLVCSPQHTSSNCPFCKFLNDDMQNVGEESNYGAKWFHDDRVNSAQ